jgi:glycerol-3-phosphate responsive antiterminator
MIYIKESLQNDHSIKIQVDGILDEETMPILKNVFERHREAGNKVFLHIDGLIHITREGKNFLKELPENAIIVTHPQFVELENQDHLNKIKGGK